MTYKDLYEFQQEDTIKHGAKKHGLIGSESLESALHNNWQLIIRR